MQKKKQDPQIAVEKNKHDLFNLYCKVKGVNMKEEVNRLIDGIPGIKEFAKKVEELKFK